MRILNFILVLSCSHIILTGAVPVCPVAGSTVQWSDDNTWNSDTHGLGRSGKPSSSDDVTIPLGEIMLLDEDTGDLGHLTVTGTLQLDPGQGNSTNQLTVSVTKLTIESTGRLIAGCADDPFVGTATFLLRGEKSTSPNDKVIVVNGGLDLHGNVQSVQWTKLSSTISASDTSLTLADPVTWDDNDEIVVAPTGFKPEEAEIFKITLANNYTLNLNTSVSNQHLGENTTLTSGKYFTMAAEVGRLTRGIKVIGEQYGAMFEDKFGGRIYVTSTGFARITNVEFYRTGVEQYPVDYSDPRFSVVFSGISDSSNQPCYIKQSAFHQGFSPAIGAFDTPSLEISDNVIHHTVGSAIITNSTSTLINHNMISLVYWPGAFGRTADSSNHDFDGAINAFGADGLVLTSNSISGTERACFHGEPEVCPNSACSSSTWSDNVFHTSLIGLSLYPGDTISSNFPGTYGWQYHGFTIYKCWDFGIYYNNEYGIKIWNMNFMDNGVSVFTMIYEPSLTEHDITTSKSVLIEDCLLVGTSPHFDCTNDILDKNADNYKKSSNARSWRRDRTNGAAGNYATYSAHTGIAWPSFTSQANDATTEPFIEPKYYNALTGVMEIKDTEFAYYKRNHCNERDAAIATNPKNFDFMHPILIDTTTKTTEVENDNLIFYHQPDTSESGQTCGSITCDGLRKAFLQDKDGTFLGAIGSAIPEAEYNWDSYITDNKIATVTHPAGFTYTVSELATYKGIIRDGCTDNTASSKWQGHYCGNGWQYRILVIESMDNDTETRSIAPVTLLGWTDSGDGVVDLISGPVWTNGTGDETTDYKISTFHAVVALDRNYSIYFNGVPPQIVRYHLLNADSNDVIRIGTSYSMPNHLDVYYNDAYQDPTNDNNNADNILDLQFDEPLSQYMPNKTSDTSGTNYLDREWNMTQIVIKGSGKVEVALAPAVVMAFTVNTTRATDGSFESDLSTAVLNLVQTVEAGVGSVNVRTANVQTNNASGTTTWWMEVSDEICSTLSTCSSSVTQYTVEQYDAFAVKLFDSYQLEQFPSSLNIIEGVWAAEALPRLTDETKTKWTTATQTSYTYFKMLKIPKTLVIAQEPVPGIEAKGFTTQPHLHLVNADGEHVPVLGASPQAWYCLASLQTGTGTYSFTNLTGTMNISFVDGWANFTDLSLTNYGELYVLDFQVVIPTGASFSVSSSNLTVLPRPMHLKMTSASSVIQNKGMDIIMAIWDNETDSQITDVAWNANYWTLTMSLSSSSVGIYTGNYTGTTTASFDVSTGTATLSSVKFDAVGLVFFNLYANSNLTDYNLTIEMTLYIFPARHEFMTFTYSVTMTIRFDLNYTEYGNIRFVAVVYTYLSNQYPDNQITNIQIAEGSVLVTFTISGTTTSVDNVLQGTCTNIVNGKSFQYNGADIELSKYLTMDNQTYYGVNCGPPDYSSVKIALIVGIALAVVFIIVIIAVTCWRLKYNGKSKTHHLGDGNTVIKSKHGNAYLVERKLGRQNTFNSISSLISDSPSPLPPISTVIPKGGRTKRPRHHHKREKVIKTRHT